MKKFLLAAIALFACVSMASAAETTFTFNGTEETYLGLTRLSGTPVSEYVTSGTQVTLDGITLTLDGENAFRLWNNGLRYYKNGLLTVASSVGNITNVKITASADVSLKLSEGQPGTFTVDSKEATWTGDAASFTLEATHTSGQIAIATLTVTTDGEGGGNTGTETPETPEPTETTATIYSGLVSGYSDWNIDNVAMPEEGLTYVWSWSSNYGYAMASGYYKQAYETRSTLTSPVIDLTDVTSTSVSWEWAGNYFTSTDNFKAAISVNISVDGGDFEDLAIETYPAGTAWTFVTNTADLSAYDGKKIQIQFVYTSTSELAGTLEVKNFVVEGVTSVTDTPSDNEAGTKSNPYTVAEAIALNNPGTTAWVEGYIVGWIDGTNISGATFTTPATGNTNLLIADSATETDYNNCMPVQLPSAIRSALGLMDNPGNLGRAISLEGSLEKYFGVPGIKTVTDYVLGEGGSDTPEEPSGAIYSGLSSNMDDWTIDNVVMPEEGLTYVWSWASAYGAKASAYTDKAYETRSTITSPEIDLSGYTDATLTYQVAANFFKGTLTESCALNISVDGGEFTALNTTWPESDSWAFIDVTVDLSAYVGKKIQLQFVYTSTEELAGTLEIKNLEVNGTEGTTGVVEIAAEESNAPTEYFNLQGVRVENPTNGLYIRRQGNKVTKVIVR